MADPGIRAIRVRRGNTVFHVHGDSAGLEGVWLAQGQVQGLYDAPIKSTWKTGAFQVGATHKAVKWLFRDLALGFHIIDGTDSYEWNESLFRQIFFYEEDRWSTSPKTTTIEVVTDISGTRKLDVLMYEHPDFTPALDPIRDQYGNLILKLRAGQPLWYEDDVTATFTSGSTSSAGTLTISNPTDQVMWHKWILTPGVWTLPDFQWVGDPGERVPGGDNGSRYVNDINITTGNGGAVIDLDRQQLMYRDLNNTNIIAQMGGSKIFNYPIPPYTPPTQIPVSYKGASGGATCQLVMPRRWSRPYGLEANTVLNTGSPKDWVTRFNFPGEFSYSIPSWCERIDIVVAPAGGGGEGGGILLTGTGGNVGNWVSRTIIRGVDIPWNTFNIVGLVGAGGAGGHGIEWHGVTSGVDGKPGGLTTVVASGMTTISAPGGTGGGAGFGEWGRSLDDYTFNGRVYPGGNQAVIPGSHGNQPGGGGAGGWPLDGKGGDGGDAQISFRAYGWSGS